MIHFDFNEVKTTQAAAKLIALRGGGLDILELLKLLYLIDREALLRWRRPVTGDRFVAMKHGPVLSMVYDLTKSPTAGTGYWQQCIQKNDQRLTLKKSVPDDEVSDREAELIVEVANKFEGIGKWTLRDFTHTLGEWKDPGDTSRPIYVEQILLAGGCTWDDIRDVDDSVSDLNGLKRLLQVQ
jgi:uncharacterized phage-associated protein